MKWTPEQKRIHSTDRGYSLDVNNNARIMAIRHVLDPALCRTAQINLAEMALAQDDPEEWLRDVLTALDLDRRFKARKTTRDEACVPYTGTRRGYNTHLRTYTYPCAACKEVTT